jgi:hypothetical protein
MDDALFEIPIMTCANWYTSNYLDKFFEAASTYEFTQDGVIGDGFAGDGDEVIEEFQEAFGFLVFWFLFSNSEQKGFCVYLQAGKLVDEC